MSGRTMWAARLHREGEPLVYEEVPVPEPRGRQVLLKVAGAGACRSDLSLARGYMPGYTTLPRILGHENTGYVEAWGDEVTGLTVGAPMAVYGTRFCGECVPCRAGEEHLCTTLGPGGLGTTEDGGFAEYLLVSDTRHLIPLPSAVDPVAAATYSDAGLTSYRAVKKAAPYLRGGSTVLVIGVGGLGQFGVTWARLLTPARVIVVDVKPAALELAAELGAEHCLDGNAPDLVEQVKQLTGGAGVEAVVDFTGSDQTMALAAAAVRQSGIFVLVGMGQGSCQYAFHRLATEATLTTSYWGTYNEHREVIDLAAQGRVPVHFTTTPLARVNELLDAMAAGDVLGRAVVVP